MNLVFEALINEDGDFVQGIEIKAIVSELQTDCSKSRLSYALLRSLVNCFLAEQQVIDILRDRLESIQGELVDAKTRTSELEAAQTEDRLTLKMLTLKLADTGAQLSGFASGLEKQQQDRIEVLSKNTELEIKLDSSAAESVYPFSSCPPV